MDIDSRVRALEVLSLHNSGKVIALEVAVRALIATHPDRNSAKAAFDRLTSEILSRVADLGFEDGNSVADTAKQTELFRQELMSLRESFSEP